jgi:hypothetical protein
MPKRRVFTRETAETFQTFLRRKELIANFEQMGHPCAGVKPKRRARAQQGRVIRVGTFTNFSHTDQELEEIKDLCWMGKLRPNDILFTNSNAKTPVRIWEFPSIVTVNPSLETFTEPHPEVVDGKPTVDGLKAMEMIAAVRIRWTADPTPAVDAAFRAGLAWAVEHRIPVLITKMRFFRKDLLFRFTMEPWKTWGWSQAHATFRARAPFRQADYAEILRGTKVGICDESGGGCPSCRLCSYLTVPKAVGDLIVQVDEDSEWWPFELNLLSSLPAVNGILSKKGCVHCGMDCEECFAYEDLLRSGGRPSFKVKENAKQKGKAKRKFGARVMTTAKQRGETDKPERLLNVDMDHAAKIMLAWRGELTPEGKWSWRGDIGLQPPSRPPFCPGKLTDEFGKFCAAAGVPGYAFTKTQLDEELIVAFAVEAFKDALESAVVSARRKLVEEIIERSFLEEGLDPRKASDAQKRAIAEPIRRAIRAEVNDATARFDEYVRQRHYFRKAFFSLNGLRPVPGPFSSRAALANAFEKLQAVLRTLEGTARTAGIKAPKIKELREAVAAELSIVDSMVVLEADNSFRATLKAWDRMTRAEKANMEAEIRRRRAKQPKAGTLTKAEWALATDVAARRKAADDAAQGLRTTKVVGKILGIDE